MALDEEFQTQGSWLFRWRSYLPLCLIALVAMAARQITMPFGSLLAHEVWERICLATSFSGLLIRVITIGYAPAGTSGRNTKDQVAESLNTTGIYSVVRHPLYLGNYLIGLGISLVMWVWWLPVIYTLAFWLYYERIMFAEEAYLRRKFGAEFTDWAARTPAFWPNLLHWRRPALPFSLRNVLRREYTGLVIVIGGHASVELAEHLMVRQYVVWDKSWIALSIGGAIAYVLLRTLKKKTKLLNVPGR
jgi:protein-S-isoprenylcysteine O-methyltransferase Ste14